MCESKLNPFCIKIEIKQDLCIPWSHQDIRAETGILYFAHKRDKMVIGNGMIAKKFIDYIDKEHFVIFASGISNSKSRSQSEYRRELDLLAETAKTYPAATLVYFSTTSIYDLSESESDYVRHKTHIEAYLAANAVKYLIVRASNLVGRSVNPNTVLNFFVHHIANGINFDLWVNASRNLLDVDDFHIIVDHVLQNGLFTNTVVNIANPVTYGVTDIVKGIEAFFGKKACYIPIQKGSHYEIDLADIAPVFEATGIRFDENYLRKLLLKYY